MRRVTVGPVLIAVSLLAACDEPKSPAEQASEDARAVAMVEAAQNVKPPPVPIEPQPITAVDIEENKIYGSGCTLVPATIPGGDPLVMANGNRALVKFSGKFVTFAADPGSPELGLGARTHYVGKAQSLRLARSPGDGTALGQDGQHWDGRAEIRDAADQLIWSAAGVVTCGG